ncbi:hypothetical protein BACCIP111895_02964 [Neobacillus rhizosphaerae]|uniref:Uncharacterized protein n=1 Tax=Neobacillus rhizosphaerae TaxID=2880965 RepID=A0ABM9EU84_9BACI|nr:hypothetical protein [Neobacillus rhizosphaerae]CAH2715780.1 hypothetical protein BACCIP111895_02964 [Neobacillus rhizosphaerae]
MNKPISEKEKLLTMLTDIYDQLEELESVLEASFSDLRISLNKVEYENLTGPVQKLADMDIILNHIHPIFTDKNIDTSPNQVLKTLKLELGF